MTTKHKIKTFENIVKDEEMLAYSHSNEYIINLFEEDLKKSKNVSNIQKFEDRFEYDFTF